MTGHVPVFGNVSPLTAKRVSSFSFLCACHFFCICNMMYGGLQINNTLCVTTQAVRFLFAILCFCSSDNVTPLYFQNSWMYVIYVNEFLFIYLCVVWYGVLYPPDFDGFSCYLAVHWRMGSRVIILSTTVLIHDIMLALIWPKCMRVVSVG